MTADEHAHMQELEGLVKRYRSRIVALKAALDRVRFLCDISAHDETTRPPAQIVAAIAETVAER